MVSGAGGVAHCMREAAIAEQELCLWLGAAMPQRGGEGLRRIYNSHFLSLMFLFFIFIGFYTTPF